MFSSFIRNFPSRLFCLSSTLFWLIMNTLAADNAYRIAIEYGRNPVWHEVWLRYIPWWGNWIILTPIVIALIKTISLDPKQRSKFIGVNLTLMILVMCFYWFITALEVALIQGDVTLQAIGNVIQEVLRSPMHLDVLMYLAVACIGFSGMYYNRSQKEALVNVKLTNQLLEVELQSLKSQLSPHFLFNTLNTISGLIRLEQKSEAVIALSELSKMFRTVLENQKKSTNYVA
ncbi:histidine kinase [Alteromonas ponticola]|uniref:Histidine kinase n=1 Tax=Alteromonas aquimaris TaxID=2998417 RepID=A0ABT3P8K5_9ALTE|nr:sensor histidine kinase [Alteromonas aquimaris]MCW8109104.1 histidine kinase [Alteromonas aquimaris]